MTKIGDLLSEFSERPGKGAEPPVLTLTEHNGFVRQADRFKKRLATEDTSRYKVVRRNDIAFNPYLLWAGAVAQNTIVDEGIISPLYPTFRVRPGNDPRFVARLLLTPQVVAAYDGIAFGSVPRRRRSSTTDFLELAIGDVPSADEQRRVAAILDAADAIRTQRREILTHLKSLTQSLFHKMFGGGTFPQVAAGELMPEMRNGQSPATAGAFPAQVLTLSAVTQGGFDPTAVKSAVFTVDPSADKRVSARDFLMCRGNGNKALVGVGTYSAADRPDLVFPDTVIAGRVATDRITMLFLDAAWKQPSVRKQIESVARTTNGTYKVNQQTLSTVTVPVPPLPEQHAFAASVSRIDAQRAAVQRALAADNELFVSLQARAFAGGL